MFTRSGGVWTQQGNKLVGTGAIGNAWQGSSVALSADGNTAIVGGPSDDGYVGATWVFTRSGGFWTQQGKKLVGSFANVGTFPDHPRQGASVAISADGNTVIVGGPVESNNIGAAWVFTRSGGVWTQQGNKLVGTGAVFLGDYGPGGYPRQAGDVPAAAQGLSVALSADGNTAIVGGPFDSAFPDRYGLGAAWVFTRSGGVWTQQGNKLVGTGAVYMSGVDNKDGVAQGWSVALSADGNTAVVGGPCDGNPGSCYYFGQADGAAWVFTRSGGVWAQQEKLVGTGATGSAVQGSSVALSADGNTVIVGGLGDDGLVGAAWVFAKPVLSTVPSIASDGVANGASFLPGVAPGTWITIKGSNLSATTRTWTGADFVGNNLPTQLDGVSVTVNGKPAYASFISPTQLNVLSPDDTTQGSVAVQVTTAQGRSSAVNAVMSALSPALFAFSPQGGRYVAAVRSDGTYIAPPNLISGLATVPAKPGDVTLLFGTGFGPTSPPVQIGQMINSAPLANQVTIRIGGVVATTQFVGIVSPGLCQFNVVVPDVPNGDNTVSVVLGGISSQPNVFLTIQR